MMQAMRSRLRNREVSERKQVGDAESMMIEGRSTWPSELEQL